jgi:hypothetical protein
LDVRYCDLQLWTLACNDDMAAIIFAALIELS